MYTPAAFRVTDDARLHALMRDYPFAVFISSCSRGLETTHLPFILDAERGEHGSLLGHMARANRHWRRFDGRQEAIAIFTGAHAYVSPSWYSDPRTVPTWNYAVVHAYGSPRIIDNKSQARSVLKRLVAEHESSLDPSWTMDQVEPSMERQLARIVVFEVEISRLEGKFKYSQNRSNADQRGIVQAFAGSGDSLQRAVAAGMQENLSGIENKG